MINKFIQTCKLNGEKAAVICNGKSFSYSRLLSDVHKMISLFEARGIGRGEKVLLLVTPSYEFYTLMLACIYYGINVVVMDSYKNVDRIVQTMCDGGINRVFCNSVTGILKTKFPKDVKFINISNYSRYEDRDYPVEAQGDSVVLTTFTSGTTGKPKPIDRSISDLGQQIDIVEKNIDIGKTSVVYAGLPIYALFLIYSGKTCIISRKIRKRELERFGATDMVAPISELLKLDEEFSFIKKLYLGGAMLYKKEAKQLFQSFPTAEITYIYGSSECVLMAKANLKDYISNNFALGGPIDGVELSIVEQDKNGIGRIMAKGDVILTDNKIFVGGDLGYIDSQGLHIVGRAAYSSVGKYNYITDERILADNPEVKKGFSFIHEDKLCFCYIGKLAKEEDGIQYYKFKRLPMDPKHRTKLNYKKAIDFIKNK